ncbi:MAG: MoaD/ThiS family protein [Candidatus Thorarchaeota archaeon]
MNKISLSIKLYGELRDKFSYKRIDAGIPNTIKLEIIGFRTVLDILKQLGIDENEISHIFVNGIYSGAGKLVKDGDRIGIFPKRMGLMFLEITKIKSIYAKITLHEDLSKFGPTESIVELPEGSTINSVLNKYNLSKKRDKIEVIVNGTLIHEQDYIIKDWDNIAFFPLE